MAGAISHDIMNPDEQNVMKTNGEKLRNINGVVKTFFHNYYGRPSLWNTTGHYIFALWFLLSSVVFLLA